MPDLTNPTSFHPPGFDPVGFAPAGFNPPVVLTGASTTDGDIFAEIQNRLLSTGKFNRVSFPDPPDLSGKQADLSAIAIITPASASEPMGWDDSNESQMIRQVTWTLEIQARNGDANIRDKQAIYLMNVARAVLDNQSLLGVTITQQTRLGSERWITPVPPLRRLTATGQFWYLTKTSTRSREF